ncbi:hypothetical protein [Photobacterium carnosum]|uniref:HPt domain-containing protein n=1 Tax=Photobacterium carnosum TaxID=2023717 RepID=A0A2N4UV94_9GAMM|nr:hypothetical protein [Photobacterium carnosum]MCD9516858.1 hypothetical protein [Photobacterium carnosum]MCD9521816.1 hypothetical protein [Photobacterium carnosum]MCD9536365.1 hypothetical protein [Photobacterium carnosum]MCD9545208.1 hypothetical protein [Photobacterium carnosum]MCD9553078.1 hypothetical protein [Photobacterium carnosum]
MINLSSFYQELDNDKESIITILELFLSEYEDFIIYYTDYFSDEKWHDIYISSHSLKGILESFGEKDLTSSLRAIEIKTSKNENITTDDLNHVINKLPEILIEIKVEIEKLRQNI